MTVNITAHCYSAVEDCLYVELSGCTCVWLSDYGVGFKPRQLSVTKCRVPKAQNLLQTKIPAKMDQEQGSCSGTNLELPGIQCL